MVLNLLIANHLPYPGGEVFPRVSHGDVDACTVDGRFDFGAGADDAFVLKKPRNIFFSHARDLLRIKVAEGFSEGLALAQDGEPGESGLESVEHERLPQRTAVALRNAPLFVVIGAHQRIVFGPGAAV